MPNWHDLSRAWHDYFRVRHDYFRLFILENRAKIGTIIVYGRYVSYPVVCFGIGYATSGIIQKKSADSVSEI